MNGGTPDDRRGSRGHGASLDWQIVGYREHVDESITQGRIGDFGLSSSLDLRKNFELAVRGGNDANDATCAEPFAPVFQHVLTPATGKGRGLRDRGEAICLRLGDLGVVRAVTDALPFADRAADHGPTSLT